ncbi:MAG: MATE family efflux transporter [Clostridiales bacterium]|nr:MATE family efflux transporter [Clostridiales bacterium]
MVGRLGETELAAVGIGVQPFFIFWMVMFGFVSGSATFMSQFWGAGDLKNVKKTLGFAICVSVGTGVVFFICGMFFPRYIVDIFTDIPEIKPLAAEYIRIGSFCFLLLPITAPITFCLRTTQQTKIPLYISSFAFCMNTFLNYVLIFGNFGAPRLGVAGAALATVISRILEMILALIVVFRGKNVISGNIKEYFGWTKDFSLRVVNNAIPTSLNETLWGLGTAAYTAAYARVGITEYAAVQAGRVIESLFMMAAFSIGDAALILVGQRLGAGELESGYQLAKKLLKIGSIIGVVFGVALIAVAKPIIGLYNFTPEGAKFTFYILVIYGAKMGLDLFNGINIVGVLRSGGDTKYAMVTESLCVWLIGVPMAFISTMWLHLPIYFAVLLVCSEEVVKFFLLIKRFVSKKWVKNVIHNL